jgi:uncharacterized cupredoxin-like copper-binding protein
VNKSVLAVAAALALNVYAELAWSHGSAQHGMKAHGAVSVKENDFGRPGDALNVTRTISVDMNDGMRFAPGEIHVKRGETIRFQVTNSGKAMHEMVLGTAAELKKHAEHMRKRQGMEHDAPSMAHVAPGKTQTILWQFTKTGEFQYGCLIPGHFEAGMIGRVRVVSN